MLLQVSCRLPIFAHGIFCRCLVQQFDVSPLLPIVNHFGKCTPTDALSVPHHAGFLVGKDFGQQVEQVSRSPILGARHTVLHVLDGLAEEAHLAPHVILERPADEVFRHLIPNATLCHKSTIALR